MDEYGEFPAIYVFPTDHEPGDPYPQDFWDKVTTALKSVGVSMERV